MKRKTKSFDFRAERLARGLTQAEIAGSLGVHQTTIMRWEKDSDSMLPFEAEAFRNTIQFFKRMRAKR